MKILAIVKGDTNDADYVTEQTDIKEKDVERLKKIAKIIKLHKKGHNWPNSEYSDGSPEELYEGKISEEDMEWFQEMVPYGENGIHTITDIQILYVSKQENLL